MEKNNKNFYPEGQLILKVTDKAGREITSMIVDPDGRVWLSGRLPAKKEMLLWFQNKSYPIKIVGDQIKFVGS